MLPAEFTSSIDVVKTPTADMSEGALGGNIDPETGLTKPLTTEDLRMDHPYNTYTEPGLPPGPISNPGRNSLDAALSPNDTSYYFYVYNPHSGKHMYAKTQREQDEHIRYINSLG